MNRSKLKLTTFLFAVSLYWINININYNATNYLNHARHNKHWLDYIIH